MTKGKIVLVPFPFDDLTATKVRPALCLTNPVGVHSHVVVAFISSRVVDPCGEFDILLDRDHPDFPATGLRVSSSLRLNRLITITTSIVMRELGTLSLDLQKQVDTKLREIFDL